MRAWFHGATLAAILSLQGCWAVFIPGSAVNSIGDGITGAEGDKCVEASAKVGDKIRFANGSVGTVASLSGTSSRCRPDTPVRAKVTF